MYGYLEINKRHKYIHLMEHSFHISPLLQSHILEFAQHLPYKRAMQLLNSMLCRTNVGSSQAQRLMQYFGTLSQVEEQVKAPGFEPVDVKNSTLDHQKEVLYAQVDGGHLLTDDGYREVKVGRIFKHDAVKCISIDNQQVNKRNQVEQSDYLANLGYYKYFTDRFDELLQNHLSTQRYELVLVSDGATWISKWQQERYANAIMILDFYHALEHLCDYAKLLFGNQQQRSIWIACRKKELLQGQLDNVIANIQQKSLGRRSQIIDKADELIRYYEKNRFRMKYDEYLSKGYFIGSGAIESAISTVAQQRCKLVGQRWTTKVQAVLNIRSLYMSHKNENLLNIISMKMGCCQAA